MKKKQFPIVILVTALTLFGCKKEQQRQQTSRVQPFPVVKVTHKTVTSHQEYPAKIEGIINNSVRAKIQGYIKEVYVDEGQPVKKGQLLFKLETDVLSQSAAATKASVEVAQVEVNKLKPLVEKGIISPVQLETAKANLMQAKASYNNVMASINYSVIKSPVDGIVGQLPFREGSLVGPSDSEPLTVVSDTRQIYAYFSMSESDYLDFLQQTKGESLKEKLSNIPSVELVLTNGHKYPEKGKIEAATAQIDPQSGTIQFRATFDNKNGLLANGSSGNILVPKVFDNVLVIPQQSTYEQQGVTYVYKVSQDTAVSTIIKVKANTDNLTIVEEGLKDNDEIVALGIGKLRSGTPIVPQPISLDSLIQSIKPIF